VKTAQKILPGVFTRQESSALRAIKGNSIPNKKEFKDYPDKSISCPSRFPKTPLFLIQLVRVLNIFSDNLMQSGSSFSN
jgi:hypothetical protein